ncbi:MAG: type II secretion system protein, partial [Planctomycetes bacterium]|nr:type II secretion system protein [Planctomycetota bacterium]
MCRSRGGAGVFTRCPNQGFSLIELLAAIAIICVLAALLGTSLIRAVYSARKVRCASSLRQVYVCPSAYESDFTTMPWGASTPCYQSFGAMSAGPVGFGLFTWFGYAESRDIFACPDTDYHPDAGTQLTTGLPPALQWHDWRRPDILPMRGVQGYVYGPKDTPTTSNSSYFGLANGTSYAYRRYDVFGGGGSTKGLAAHDGASQYPFVSYKRQRLDAAPLVILACCQRV